MSDGKCEAYDLSSNEPGGPVGIKKTTLEITSDPPAEGRSLTDRVRIKMGNQRPGALIQRLQLSLNAADMLPRVRLKQVVPDVQVDLPAVDAVEGEPLKLEDAAPRPALATTLTNRGFTLVAGEHGTFQTLLDGHPIPMVQALELDISADSVPTLTLDMIPGVIVQELSTGVVAFRTLFGRRRRQTPQIQPDSGESLYDALQAAYSDIIQQYKVAVADKQFTVREAFDLLTRACASFVQITRLSTSADGKLQKEAVIKAAERFYSEVLAPMDIPHIPAWLEERVVDPIIGRFVPNVVSGMIDAMLSILEQEDVSAAGSSPAMDGVDPAWVPY